MTLLADCGSRARQSWPPSIMALEPDPMPGDFVLAVDDQHYAVPVLWSLCASGALALLYFMKAIRAAGRPMPGFRP